MPEVLEDLPIRVKVIAAYPKEVFTRSRLASLELPQWPTAPFPPSQKGSRDLTELLVGIACGMAITLTALFLGVMPLVRHLAGARDYVVYWSTGQQLVHHANPYDPVAMGDLERSAGFDGKRGVVLHAESAVGFAAGSAAGIPRTARRCAAVVAADAGHSAGLRAHAVEDVWRTGHACSSGWAIVFRPRCSA